MAPPIANRAEPIMNRTPTHQPITSGAQKCNQECRIPRTARVGSMSAEVTSNGARRLRARREVLSSVSLSERVSETQVVKGPKRCGVSSDLWVESVIAGEYRKN